MVRHDKIDLLQIDLLFQVLDKFKSVRRPHRINKDRFFFLDQIGILAGTVHDRIIISMKGLQFPVDIANPAYISFYMLSQIFTLLID